MAEERRGKGQRLGGCASLKGFDSRRLAVSGTCGLGSLGCIGWCLVSFLATGIRAPAPVRNRARPEQRGPALFQTEGSGSVSAGPVSRARIPGPYPGPVFRARIPQPLGSGQGLSLFAPPCTRRTPPVSSGRGPVSAPPGRGMRPQGLRIYIRAVSCSSIVQQG